MRWLSSAASWMARLPQTMSRAALRASHSFLSCFCVANTVKGSPEKPKGSEMAGAGLLSSIGHLGGRPEGKDGQRKTYRIGCQKGALSDEGIKIHLAEIFATVLPQLLEFYTVLYFLIIRKLIFRNLHPHFDQFLDFREAQ